MSSHPQRLKIGISACFFHPDQERPIFKGKTLQYIEQSVAHWVMSQGDLAVMIPSPEGDTQVGDAQIADYAQWLDGVVLMGGSDVWPGSYGEEVMDPRWVGDRVRDAYEKKLIESFVAAGKPVLGMPRYANDQCGFWRHFVPRHCHAKTRCPDAPRRRKVRSQFARGAVRTQ